MTEREDTAGTLPRATMTASGTVMTEMGVHFALALSALLKRCRDIDGNEASATEHQALVLSIIIDSACMCEALANDVCERVRDYGPGILPKADPERAKLLGAAYDAGLLKRGGNAIDTWKQVFALLRIKFDTDTDAVRDMRELIELRNAFVHARPGKWSNPVPHHEGLEKRLVGKFPFAGDARSLFFPTRVLSTGAAEWAVKVAGEFCRYVIGEIGYHDGLTQLLCA